MRTAFYAILAAALARTCIAIPTARDALEAREIADVKLVEGKAIRRQIGAAASAFLANLTETTTTTELPLCSATTVSGFSSSTYINATLSTILSSGTPISTSTGIPSCQIPTTTSTSTIDSVPILSAESTETPPAGRVLATVTGTPSTNPRSGGRPVSTVWATEFTTLTAVVIPSTVVVIATSTITERPTAAFVSSRSAFADSI